MKGLCGAVLGAAVLLGVSGALAQRGAPSAVNEPRAALVIGNSAYKIDPLKNPVNDAEDMARALRALGFRVTLRKNADRRQMVSAINEFGQELKKGGVGLFYYAGHGVQSKGRNWLVPIGTHIESEGGLEFETVDAYRVLALMEEAGNRVNIVILDACRNNPFARAFRSPARGLAQMEAAKGSFLAFATAPGSVAADGPRRNGLYTEQLLASLKHPDSDIDKVFRRVTAEVSRATGNKQVPWISSSLTGDFYFRLDVQVTVTALPAVVTPDPAAIERAFWESVKDSKNPEELKAYLEQFPDGLFAALAQARLKSLEPTQVATAAPSTAVIRPKPAPGSIASLAPGTTFRDCDVCPEMVVIPAGSFMMGSPESEQGRSSNEGPQHQVTISKPFAAGKYEVTFDEWDACVREGGCGHNPSDDRWGRGRRPVIHVSWNDAKQYVEWLSRKTGANYRLLTEAEWEYAARAGTTTPFSTGARINPVQANYNGEYSYAGSVTGPYLRQTVSVGSYTPNALGLYDVHGNVWERVEDCWNGSYEGAPSDGSAWTSGDCRRRVVRGGSHYWPPLYLRSANRNSTGPDARSGGTGLRVARAD